MGKPFAERIEKIIGKAGYFFSYWVTLLALIVGYLLVSAATYCTLYWIYHYDVSKAFYITYSVATGGDPYTLTIDNVNIVRGQHYWLWRYILLFRFGVWLFVPVLIAATLDAAYRVFEHRREKALIKVIHFITKMGREELGLSGTQLDDFVKKQLEEMKSQSEL